MKHLVPVHSWSTLVSLLLLASACAPPVVAQHPTPTATLAPAPQPTTDSPRPRLMALITGRLVQLGACLRVRAEREQTDALLVWPPDFDMSLVDHTLIVTDRLEHQQVNVHLGDYIELGGGELPQLDETLRTTAGCPGPYWVVGSLPHVVLPTPMPPTAAPADNVTVTGRIVLGYADHSPVADLPLWLGTESLGPPITRTDASGVFTLTGQAVRQVVNVVDDHLTFQFTITQAGKFDAGTFYYPLIHPGPELTPTPPATPAAAAERHQPLTAGLTLDEYALAAPPDGDRIADTSPLSGSWADIVARHQGEGGAVLWPDFTTDAQGRRTLTVQWRGQPLLARELLNASPRHLDLVMRRANPLWHLVQVWQGDRSLYLISTGDVSPVDKLRAFLAYGDHWLLEVAYVASYFDAATGLIKDTVTGYVVQDGVLLNTPDSDEEAFGLQLLRGQPFYFYQRTGQFGIVYAGQHVPLGYDGVPHYGCCSNAMLNPIVRTNMVSFFARRGQTWYYVEIGAYG